MVEKFTPEQLDMIRETVASELSDPQFKQFIYKAEKLGLDPLLGLIHPVLRNAKDYSSGTWVKKMTVQTGIDGFRLIADRTEHYAPGSTDTLYTYGEDGLLRSAKVYVKKLVAGEWHEFSAEAFFEEYAQKTNEGKLTVFWMTKGHIMTAKCAEVLALRRAFPAELSGIYTNEEMMQADNEMPVSKSKPDPKSKPPPKKPPATEEPDSQSDPPADPVVQTYKSLDLYPEFDKAKEFLGEEQYHECMRRFGYEKRTQIPPKVRPKVLEHMRNTARQMKAASLDKDDPTDTPTTSELPLDGKPAGLMTDKHIEAIKALAKKSTVKLNAIYKRFDVSELSELGDDQFDEVVEYITNMFE